MPSAHIVKHWPGAKNASASPSASAMVIVACLAGDSASSQEITAGKYSW